MPVPSALTYPTLNQALVILGEQNDGFGVYTVLQSPDWAAYEPLVINYAEARIYREVCPLATRLQNASSVAVAGQRTIGLGTFNNQPVALEGIALVTPAGTPPAQGQRWQYEKVSLDFIDSIWPVEATTMSPSAAYPELYWAMLDAQNIVLAPTPDQAYVAEGTGIFRASPLSAANPSTYISTFYPDLFLSACMISVAGFERDYGAQSEDPKLALSWEGIYQGLKVGALLEEQMRRGQMVDAGGTAKSPEAAEERAGHGV